MLGRAIILLLNASQVISARPTRACRPHEFLWCNNPVWYLCWNDQCIMGVQDDARSLNANRRTPSAQLICVHYCRRLVGVRESADFRNVNQKLRNGTPNLSELQCKCDLRLIGAVIGKLPERTILTPLESLVTIDKIGPKSQVGWLTWKQPSISMFLMFIRDNTFLHG